MPAPTCVTGLVSELLDPPLVERMPDHYVDCSDAIWRTSDALALLMLPVIKYSLAGLDWTHCAICHECCQ